MGYPERFAQQALGHNNQAVQRAYARRAQVQVPSLGEYERNHAQLAEHQIDSAAAQAASV